MKRRFSQELEKNFIIRMHPKMICGLNKLAKKDGRSASGMIRRLIGRALAANEKTA